MGAEGRLTRREEIPSTLLAQREDGEYLGWCDMGNCSNEQTGWALAPCLDTDPEWLASCGPCGEGYEFIGFDRVDAALSTKDPEGRERG